MNQVQANPISYANVLAGQNDQAEPSSSKTRNSRNRQPGFVVFTQNNRMPLKMVELRIDYHLNRIMKSYRLNNFNNAIANLNSHSKICEKILEILNSTEQLIDRKCGLLLETKEVMASLSQLIDEVASRDDSETKDILATQQWDKVKRVSTQSEQLMWALNSNKEHLRYVARIFVVPDKYRHSSEEVVDIKEQFLSVVKQCDELVNLLCQARDMISDQLRHIYADVRLVQPSTSSKAPAKAENEVKAQEAEKVSTPGGETAPNSNEQDDACCEVLNNSDADSVDYYSDNLGDDYNSDQSLAFINDESDESVDSHN